MSQINIFSAKWRDINISVMPPTQWANYRPICGIISRLISCESQNWQICSLLILFLWRVYENTAFQAHAIQVQPVFLQGFFRLWMWTVEPKHGSAAETAAPKTSFQTASAQLTLLLSPNRSESGTLMPVFDSWLEFVRGPSKFTFLHLVKPNWSTSGEPQF